MLNTGKLTELKAVPEELLGSLLVSKAIEAMKSRSVIDNGWMTALDKDDLHRGSLSLVAVPFRRSKDDPAKSETGDGDSSYDKRGDNDENKLIPLLKLSAGEVVEILGPFPIDRDQDLRNLHLFGR